MFLYGSLWFGMVPYGPLWFPMVPYGSLLSCMVPYSSVFWTPCILSFIGLSQLPFNLNQLCSIRNYIRDLT